MFIFFKRNWKRNMTGINKNIFEKRLKTVYFSGKMWYNIYIE